MAARTHQRGAPLLCMVLPAHCLLLLLLLNQLPQASAAVAVASTSLLVNPTLPLAPVYKFSTNGGNISGSMPVGWIDDTAWAGAAAQIKYSPLSGAACGGWSPCLKASMSGKTMQVGQRVKLPTGKAYRLSIWVRAQLPAGSTALGISAALNLRLFGAPYTVFAQNSAIIKTGWTQLLIEYGKLPGTAAKAGQPADAYFLLAATGPGTLYIAMASLQPATEQNLLRNSQFSTGSTYSLTLNGGNISGTMAERWSDMSSWGGAAINIRYTPQMGAACAGQQSCMQARVGGSFMQLGQFVTLKSGAYYRLRVLLRATPLPGTKLNGAVMALHFRMAAAPYTVYAQANVLATPTWQEVTIPVVQLPPRVNDIGAVFVVVAGGPAVIQVASASLVQLTGSAYTQPATPIQTPSTVPVPRDYFCLHSIFLFQNTSQTLPYGWPILDFGTFRTWDSGLAWWDIQYFKRGVFDWRRSDYVIQQATARKQKVMFTLGKTPMWASRNPTRPALFCTGCGDPPKNLSDWTAFITQLARRYKGRIQYYELWNEPDYQAENGFFWGTPADLVKLERAAAAVLAREDPAAKLLLPAMYTYDNAYWLNRYLAAGGGKNTQGMAWHAYIAAPEAAAGVVQTIRNVLNNYGLGSLDLYMTEGGLNVNKTKADGLRSAGWLARTMIMQWGIGSKTSCWYAYNQVESYEGMVQQLKNGTNDPSRLDEGGMAYRQVMKWMVGARMMSLGARTDGVWQAPLLRSAAATTATQPARSWIVWNPKGNAPYTVPVGWKATKSQHVVTGAISTIKSGVLTVGTLPVLIW